MASYITKYMYLMYTSGQWHHNFLYNALSVFFCDSKPFYPKPHVL